jgi:hypothetical protein
VRSGLHADAQLARSALWFAEVQAREWRAVGDEAMARQAADAELRRVWAFVHADEAARDDLWSIVRQLARLATPQGSRLDRLRCAGNGVVPQQAAAAIRSLLWELTT